MPVNTWFYAVVVQDANTAKLYINGVLRATSPSSDFYAEASPWIGTKSPDKSFSLDEMRFSEVPRSADWVLLDYITQKNSVTTNQVPSVQIARIWRIK